ncbi:MAG: right-handed parallel beta-helix repeat-containing protein [Planctomycetaceae bacterium]|nr:MAG: right-handed parallel beta-helix repeat-containing protein [Planctomycetaceae bacterium]
MLIRILVVLVLFAGAISPSPALGWEWFVATDGDDANLGTRQAPFRTIERARDAMRDRIAADGVPESGSQIVLRGGRYFRSQTLNFGQQDSGREGAPVVLRAAEGETVYLDGGRVLDPSIFVPVTDAAIMARLTDAASGRVLQADLRELGIPDTGPFGPRGWGRPRIPPPLELFVDGVPQTVARWPNTGHVPLGKVLESGSVPRRGEQDGRSAVFHYNTSRAARWAEADELFISGILGVSWAHDTIRIAEIDLERETFTTDGPSHYGVAQPGSPANVQTFYHAVNLLEEIEVPGEYYVDRKAGVLYFLPPYPLDRSLVQVSLLTDVMIRARDASYLEIQGLVLENSRGQGIVIEGGRGCRLAGCTLRNLGQEAVRIVGGTRHGVQSCDIYQVGAGAVTVSGGDRKQLIPAEHFVRNCDIRRSGRWTGHYHPLISAAGVGITIQHNHLHDSDHQAITFSGNEHVIERNEVHHVLQDISDMGSIYIGRNPSFCGNVIRYNFFHHLFHPHEGGPGTQAIFFDDDTLYVARVFGNVFYRTGSTGVIKFNGGGGASIANNIAIDSPRLIQGGHSAHVDRAIRFMHGSDTDPSAFTGRGFVPKITQEVDIRRDPYRSRYPYLYDTYANKFNYGTPSWNNYEASADDLDHFVDPAELDFTLRPDSPILNMVAEDVVDRVHGAEGESIAFQPIPFDTMGLTQDTFRQELSPFAFRLLGPADGADGLPADRVQLWWQPAHNADVYRVAVATDNQMVDKVIDQVVEDNTMTLDELEPGQTYYWQVQAEVNRSRSNRGQRPAADGPWRLTTSD